MNSITARNILRCIKLNLDLIIVAIAIILYVAIFSLYSIYVHRSFSTSAYDLGLADQAIWLLSQGENAWSTIKGVHRFGDHASFYDALIYAPAYRLYPAVETLLFVQSLFLGLSALPIFLIARRQIASRFLAVVVSLSFLLHPAIQNMNKENFHSESISVFFILMTIYFLVNNRLLASYIFAFLSVVGKEDIGITIAAIGATFSLAQWRIKPFLPLIMIGVLWFLFATQVLMPFFQGNELESLKEPAFFSAWFREFSANPFNFSLYEKKFLDLKVLTYLNDLLAPLGYVSLFSFVNLFASLPAILINCISGSFYLVSVKYHYNYCVIPGLVLAQIEALRRLRYLPRRQVSFCLSVALGIFIMFFALRENLKVNDVSVTSYYSRFIKGFTPGTKPEYLAREYAFKLIPPEESVSASHSLVPHLSHRPEIYMFPNPFRGKLWNMWFKQDYGLPSPKTINYVLLDWSALEKENKIIANLIKNSNEFKSIFRDSNIQLFKRVSDSRAEDISNGINYNFQLIKAKAEEKASAQLSGRFRSLYFPTSRYRFRNIAGEELPINNPFKLELEGFFYNEHAGELAFECNGSCQFFIEDQGPFSKQLLETGFYKLRVVYENELQDFGLKPIIVDQSGERHSIADANLFQNVESYKKRKQELGRDEPEKPDNLLINSGFEEFSQDEMPLGWSVEEWKSLGGSPVYEFVSEAGTGRAAKITNQIGADARLVQKVILKRGRTYRLEGKIKSSEISNLRSGGYLAVESKFFRKKSTAVFGSTDWAQVTVEFSTSQFHPESFYAKIVCRLGDYGQVSTGTLYCDDIILQELPD